MIRRGNKKGNVALSRTKASTQDNNTIDEKIKLQFPADFRRRRFVARLKSLPMILFKGVVKKALLQDLNDIKSAIEKD